jgi:single-stranded DNA-binding protein
MSAINLSVVRGLVSAPPEVRQLESGRRVAALSVRTSGTNGKDTSVPVAVWDPPAWVEELDTGGGVIVVGKLRRRFFQTAAGGRGAKTEIEAETIARARDRKRLASIARRIDAALDELEEID